MQRTFYREQSCALWLIRSESVWHARFGAVVLNACSRALHSADRLINRRLCNTDTLQHCNTAYKKKEETDEYGQAIECRLQRGKLR